MKRDIKHEIKTLLEAHEAINWFEQEHHETNHPPFSISLYLLLVNLTDIVESYHVTHYIQPEEKSHETITT